jgi:hypothetical protein
MCASDFGRSDDARIADIQSRSQLDFAATERALTLIYYMLTNVKQLMQRQLLIRSCCKLQFAL